tara:strand:+ start:34284 stop:34484 length:201 start_codon:yes stop_codon:yes gene_type:complete
MSRQWADFATPQELERIQLVRDINNNDADTLTLIKAYEKRVLYWQTKRGKAILAKHKKFIKDNYKS